ncbi:MAG: hypothetical protein ACJ8FB_07510 [Sphingomicrobium sp.]
MPTYRLYCLDDRGQISLANWIEADTDQEAVAEAQALEHGALSFEVWQGKRLVAELAAKDLAD